MDLLCTVAMPESEKVVNLAIVYVFVPHEKKDDRTSYKGIIKQHCWKELNWPLDKPLKVLKMRMLP